ncbi:hypothetical protein HGRIS_003860 [Hohenbuehelia grisea]|uniref:Uncharacterized protein n=1 Tax=Hohenbuehelia grisea TaxID=104357 RepID=A0ABR3JGX1_9AGAR
MSSDNTSPLLRELAERTTRLMKYQRPFHTERPDNAYGFLLTEECILRFGRLLCEREGWFPDPGSDPSVEVQMATIAAFTELAPLTQVAIPELRLTRWRLVLVKYTHEGELTLRRVLVLSDDGSVENRKMKNSVEVEEQLVKFLGLGDQKPAWYSVCKCG